MKPLADICSCFKLKLTSLFSSENQTQFYVFIYLCIYFYAYFNWKRDKNIIQESHVLQTWAIIEISYMTTLEKDIA